MTKVKNSKYDKTQNVTKLKMWQASTIKNVTKIKTQNVTKLKMWQNSKNPNCDNPHKCQKWLNSKTQNVTKLKNSKCDRTQKPKMGQN